MDIQDAREQICKFAENPYLKVAGNSADELIDNNTEKNHAEFGMVLGGLLVNAPIRELESSLATAQDYYDENAGKTLKHLSHTCENAEDSLASVVSIGQGNMREAAHAIKDLQAALSEIVDENEGLNEDTWEF